LPKTDPPFSILRSPHINAKVPQGMTLPQSSKGHQGFRWSESVCISRVTVNSLTVSLRETPPANSEVYHIVMEDARKIFG